MYIGVSIDPCSTQSLAGYPSSEALLPLKRLRLTEALTLNQLFWVTKSLSFPKVSHVEDSYSSKCFFTFGQLMTCHFNCILHFGKRLPDWAVIMSVNIWQYNFSLPTNLFIVMTLYHSLYLQVLCPKFGIWRCYWATRYFCSLNALHVFVARGSWISINPFEYFFWH